VLREAGADAVYSCRSISDAMAILDNHQVGAAILDVRVGRHSITPVARKLAQQATPFLFYTGQRGGDRIMLEWPDQPVISKPVSFQKLVYALAGLLGHKPALRCSAG
jgi:DNA-binding response OmpR family regulator